MDSGTTGGHTMKKLYTAVAALLIFGIVSTCVMLILSPDIVPVHYNAAGVIDRFGSKYEYLIFPGFSILITLLYCLLLVYMRKKNAPQLEQQVLLYTAIFTTFLFDVLGLFFGILAMRNPDASGEIHPDSLWKLTNVGTGILLMLAGNLMPKARRNSLFGLRTKWSMANDRVWQKSQRFGGFSAVICGLILTILAVVLPGRWNMGMMITVLFIWCILCILASRHYGKAEEAQRSPD